MIKDSLTAKPQVLAAAVGWAAKFVAAKPVVPVHAGIMLEAADGTLVLTSYSENVSTRAVVPIEGDAAGRAVVSGRLLAELVKTMPDKPITLTGADDHLVMNVGKFRATLPTLDEGAYPDPPATPAPIGTVNGDAFADMVHRVAAAASDDLTTRVALAGIQLTFMARSVIAISTDSYRAARGHVPFDFLTGSGPIEALALAGSMADVAAAFTGPDDITIGLDGSNLSLTSPVRSITVRLLGEQYVDVSRHLAVEHPQHALVKVADLLGPLKRAEIVREKKGPIRIDVSEGALTVVAKANDVAQDSDETVDADYTGPDHSLAFNPGYLDKALTTAPGDVVDLAFTTEKLAQVLVTVPGDDTWRHVLVPIRL